MLDALLKIEMDAVTAAVQLATRLGRDRLRPYALSISRNIRQIHGREARSS